MSRRRRALVLLNSLAVGGTQLNALDTAVRLADHGWDSLLVGPRDTLPGSGPSLFDVARSHGVRLESYERPSSVGAGARLFERLAVTFGAELVHAYGTSETIRSAYWGPCRLGRRPLVLTVYEMQLSPRTMTGPALIVGTGYLLEEARGTRPGPVRLVSPPVDTDLDDKMAVDSTDFVAEHALPAGDLRLGLVSRLDDEMKALSVRAGIDALPLLQRDDVTLVVAGGGTAEGRLRAAAERMNERLGRRAVVLVGAVADPRPVYGCVDIGLGMGGSAARALSFGLPVVAQGENGWSDVFRPETAAAIYRRSFWSDETVADPAALLAGHLRTLIEDRRLRDRLSAFGRAFAVEHFSLDRMTAEVADIYEEAVRSYGPQLWAADLAAQTRMFGWRAEAVLRSLGRRTGVAA